MYDVWMTQTDPDVALPHELSTIYIYAHNRQLLIDEHIATAMYIQSLFDRFITARCTNA